MIHIYDNVYDNDMLKQAQQWALSLPSDDTWFDMKDIGIGQHLMNIASKCFNLKDAIGCEIHINSHSPHGHFDKDEGLFMKTGKLSFPLCGIVWYPIVDMTGGHLTFPDSGVEIKPKTNRLVIFAGHLFHDGTPHQGLRKSVGMNPWKKKPMTYEME